MVMNCLALPWSLDHDIEGVLGNWTELMSVDQALEANDLLDKGVYLRWESKSVKTEDTFIRVFDEVMLLLVM